MGPTGGSETQGAGGGKRTLNPQMVVLFFISRPHLNLLRLFVRMDSMFSLRSDLLTLKILKTLLM